MMDAIELQNYEYAINTALDGHRRGVLSLEEATEAIILNLPKSLVKKSNDIQPVSECMHPRKDRDYIGNNLLRCNLCGKTFN